jgi:ubiquinone/menaquinone biosynthesis C-methylase UbiE
LKDNFSKQASGYAKYRPNYPNELFQEVLQQIDQFDNAWDVGTGNGQVAQSLSNYFKNVFATDISEKQIQQAVLKSNIQYSIASAEHTSFPADYFNLITVAQAIHWFQFEAFYTEVKRVAKKNAAIAIWGYGLLKISKEIDEHIQSFYTETIGPYWDPERKLIDQEYKTIPFPFEVISTPSFAMEYHWTLSDLEGYLNTWSSVQHFIRQNGTNPVPILIKELAGLWRSEEIKKITFPIFLKLGRIR